MGILVAAKEEECMGKVVRWALAILLFLGAVVVIALFLEGKDIAVLAPKGMIGLKQKKLLLISTWLMLIVVVPVLIMTLVISWRYREGNPKAKYRPDWENNHLAEVIWWGFPLVIVTILSIVDWKSCHALDPYKPIASNVKPVKVQVVALQWKWLFIYPEERIAAVNFVQFPVQTPVDFEITSDAPMNSFWIPELGGQIYAMAGMKTKLHLIADEVGEFRGSSANLSGIGFSGMRFIARSSSQQEFDAWVQQVKESASVLTQEGYNQLVEPSENNPVAFYRVDDETLYEQIIMKYMEPPHE